MSSKFSPNPRPNKRPPICWPPPEPPWIPPDNPWQVPRVPWYIVFHVPAHGFDMLEARSFRGEILPEPDLPEMWFSSWTDDTWDISATLEIFPIGHAGILQLNGQDNAAFQFFEGRKEYANTAPGWPANDTPRELPVIGYGEKIAIESLFQF